MGQGVLVIGSINMDLVIQAQLPKPGETRFGRDFRMIPGGKGANQAVAAARLGAETAMFGRVGQDAFADALRNNLADAGVNVSMVERDVEAASGVALIVVQPDGENSILLASGSNMALRPDDLSRAEALFEGAAVVLLQFEIPLDVVDRALDMARAHGCCAVLDAGPAVQAPPELLAKAHVLSPNEVETAALLDMPVDDLDSAREAAQRFRDMGVENVLLKLGGRGALLATDAGQEHAPAFDVEPKDTTAAGDAFTGAVGVAISEGRTLSEAVRFANAAGAVACLRAGAQPSLPLREEVETFLRQHTA